MKERPILFNTEMVRAVLAGTKTQTRRVAKTVCSGRVKEIGGARNWHLADPDAVKACPYGVPGDRLWVRETFTEGDECFIYKEEWEAAGCVSLDGLWRPSIFMPRAASRITLEVTGVRVERVKDISEEDAEAEGVNPGGPVGHIPTALEMGRHRYQFCGLWDSINEQRGYGWEKNPWVWVVEFEVLKK